MSAIAAVHRSITADSATLDAQSSRLLQLSVGAWLVFWLIMSWVVLTCEDRNETREYRGASLRWLSGEPLYNETGHGFLYLPQAAVLFIPWAVLPHDIGEVIWRFCTMGSMAFATASLARCASRRNWPYIFWIATLTTIPVCCGAARNGQMTLLMGALMLQALVDLSVSRWNRAAVLLALAFAAKPIVLPAVLLAAALWPRTMLGRLMVAMFAVLIFPFAFQTPEYVLDQFREFPRMLQAAYAVGHREAWTQLFGMFWTLGVHVPNPVQTSLRFAAAVFTLVIAWHAQRKMPPRQFALFFATITSTYILLFNPRTMGNTYALIGPAMGCYAAIWQTPRPWPSRITFTLAWVIAWGFELGKLVIGKAGIHILAPLSTVIFLALCFARPRWDDDDSAATADEPIQGVKSLSGPTATQNRAISSAA